MLLEWHVVNLCPGASGTEARSATDTVLRNRSLCLKHNMPEMYAAILKCINQCLHLRQRMKR